MAIRELIATSPIGQTIAGRVDSVHELAKELDRFRGEVAEKLSILAEWVEHKYISVTSSYVVQDETVVLANGAITISLPPSTSETVNRDIHVKNIGATSVTIAANGSDTIDGASTYVIVTQYISIHLVSDGAGKWHII